MSKMNSKERMLRANTIRQMHANGNGLTASELAKQFNLSKRYIYSILMNNLCVDPAYTPFERLPAIAFEDEIVSLRKKGYSLAEIARMVGMKAKNKPFTVNTIYVVLRDAKQRAS